MLLQVLNDSVIILIVFTSIVIIMKTVPLTTLIDKHGREVVAEMVGCHLTNINHVISMDREVYAVLDDSSQIMHCFEVKKFPNRKISKAKKSKTPSSN